MGQGFMMQVHIIDALGVYKDTLEVDPLGPQPENAVYAQLPQNLPGHTRMWSGQMWLQVLDEDVPERPEPPITYLTQNEAVSAAQERLDAFARTRNYDGILSLCTYATSLISKFKSEGEFGVLVRDRTWAKLYEILEEVSSGVRPSPVDFSDIEPELPSLEWPKDV